MLSPLLYSLFTHDCMTMHNFNTIMKFSDNTTVVGLITDGNETAYREEVRDLAVSFQDNNLSLNVAKTNGLILDNRKWKFKHAPVYIDGAVVERIDSFKFIGVHLTISLMNEVHIHKPSREEGMTTSLYQTLSEEGPKNCQRLQPHKS
jgi:hypothetical protein